MNLLLSACYPTDDMKNFHEGLMESFDMGFQGRDLYVEFG